jgi:hypothetical protein
MYDDDEREDYELNILTPPMEISMYDHAAKRISQIYHQKYGELQDKFHFYEAKPKSLKELREWLDNKKYTISDHGLKEEADFQDTWSNWKSHFRWGPAFDKEGYEEALKKLDKAENAALDIVHICTEDEDKRLKAVQDFENTLQ